MQAAWVIHNCSIFVPPNAYPSWVSRGQNMAWEVCPALLHITEIEVEPRFLLSSYILDFIFPFLSHFEETSLKMKCLWIISFLQSDKTQRILGGKYKAFNEWWISLESEASFYKWMLHRKLKAWQLKCFKDCSHWEGLIGYYCSFQNVFVMVFGHFLCPNT